MEMIAQLAQELMAGLPIGPWALGMLMVAAFVAGLVDAMAGGGGFVFLPSCLLVGMPASLALEQNKATAAFGTLAAIGNFARKKIIPWRAAALGMPFSLLGSYFGADMLVGLSAKEALTVIIVLLPIAFVVTTFIGRRRKAGGESGSSSADLSEGTDDRPLRGKALIVLPLVTFAIGWYDGFFGPGTGTLLLLFLHSFLGMSLLRSSALAKVFNFGSNVAALGTFLLKGQIILPLILPLACLNILGNITGSQLAMKKGHGLLQHALTFSLALLVLSVAAKWLAVG